MLRLSGFFPQTCPVTNELLKAFSISVTVFLIAFIFDSYNLYLSAYITHLFLHSCQFFPLDFLAY